MSSEPPLELDGVRGRFSSFCNPARFLYELLLTMFSFSACIPSIFGGVEKVGGGVGGTSPVIFTSASIPAHRSFSAVMGPIVNTSRWLGEGADPSEEPAEFMVRPLSRDGFGFGGRIYVKLSFESWT